MSVIETFPQLIGYDPDVYNYFAEQTHLCGFDLNLTYPQHGGHFPTLLDGWEDAPDAEIARYKRKSLKQTKTALRIATKTLGANHVKRGSGVKHLQGRANGTIDPWYRCALLDEVWDYAVNYTVPWSELDLCNARFLITNSSRERQSVR
jgi:carboxypeptidase D